MDSRLDSPIFFIILFTILRIGVLTLNTLYGHVQVDKGIRGTA